MKITKKRFPIRQAAAMLAVSMAAEGTGTFAAWAAEPYASVDETLYINLDHYGSVTEANIVKSVDFNSLEDYTDYGDYISLTNMSTPQELKLENGSVTLKAPVDGSRMYFEGGLAPESVIMPWTFDVTYKLNGKVSEAEDIAGASGLVEIDIDAYPNEAASEYMKNNFVLMIAVPVDTNKYYSVDAPDSQRAVLGEYNCVIFEALPGKEGHFEVRLGTESFETPGVIMTMSPMTVGDLDKVKNLKELNDKFRDNTNAMFDDIDAVMDNVTDISDQLELTNQMLGELKEGKDKLHAASGGIFEGNDAAISDLKELSELMTPLDTSLKTMEWFIYDINKTLNDTDQDILSAGSKMKTLSSRLKGLGSSLNGTDGISEAELKSELEDLKLSLDKINSGLSTGAAAAGNLNAIAGLGSIAANVLIIKEGLINAEYGEQYLPQAVIGCINACISSEGADINVMAPEDIRGLKDSVTAMLCLYDELKAAGADSLDSSAMLNIINTDPNDPSALLIALSDAGVPADSLDAVTKELAAALSQAGGDAVAAFNLMASQEQKDNASRFTERLAAMKELKDAAESIRKDSEAAVGSSTADNLQDLTESLKDMAEGVNEAYGSADTEELLKGITAVSKDIEEISLYAGSVSFQTARVLESLRNLAGDMDELTSVMNAYYEDTQAAVENTDKVLLQTQKTTADLADTLKTVNDTLRSAEENMNRAADLGVDAGKKAVENTGEIVENVKDLKASGADLRKAINDELDENEAENNFLNMDPDAAKVSLTSDKNAEPASVSIILRTEEINDGDSSEEAILDAEEEAAQSTVLERIADVFRKIWNTIKGIFTRDE